MLLGVIADDFTGASDIANTLARRGLATALVTGAEGGDLPECDACVIALKTRSIPAAEAVAQSMQAFHRLKDAGCRQYAFKYCSTFDSTPQGNIGPVAETLATALNAKGVVCCPAFPAAGRTIYQGHLFVNDALLSESGMEKHPLNPMTDSNIRRWLKLQCKSPVGFVNHATVQRGAAAVRAMLADRDEVLVIADATSDADLLILGEAAAGAPLITGGSGIALGLAENFRKAGLLKEKTQGFSGLNGPAVVLAGSCSKATLAQITAYRGGAPASKVDIGQLMAGNDQLPALLSFASKNAALAPLIYSTDQPDQIARLQAKHGQETLANALDALFGNLANALVGAGFSRIVVAGGETSGAVVSALKIQAFKVGPEIAPGVPCLLAQHTPPLSMALKSGNFGDENFFTKAIAMLGGRL